MKQRLITGICYVLVLLTFFLLKIFLPAPWGAIAFDALIYLFAIIGAHEMTRALGNRITSKERGVCLFFAAIFLPAIELFYYVWDYPIFDVVGIEIFCVMLVLSLLFVVDYGNTTIESFGCALLACFYPTILLLAFYLCNHFNNLSDVAILMILGVAHFADSIAYVFGVLLGKKFPKKMAPKISPHKTVIGGIGGVIGGIVGALVLYALYTLILVNFLPIEPFDWSVLPLYVIIGIVASLASEFGDLVESAIKRHLNIKDMGKLLPGHGGILDRIDGCMYAAIAVYLAMKILPFAV